jgi:hypothetical protein
MIKDAVFFSSFLGVLLLAASTQYAHAAGTFINAPDRVDLVYDDTRDILFITSGDAVLRYQVASNTFLSPLILGGKLKGIDISLDKNTLAVADASYTENEVWVHLIDLTAQQTKKVPFARSSYEGGTFTVAFGNDNNVLVSSTYLGSGWVPLRKFNPATGESSQLTTVRQNTMLKASADASVIGFAESNISDGRFGRYRVSDGNILRKQGYTDGTGWFNYEMGVSRDGKQYSIPTYGGTFVADADLVKYATIGQYAGEQPIGVAYHPTKDLVYFAWVTTPYVMAYDTTTFTRVQQYDFENTFNSNGNSAFVDGRLKFSLNGKLLFSTVQGGIRFVRLNAAPIAEPQTVSTVEDTAKTITLTGSDADQDILNYVVVEGPKFGKLSGTSPNLTYLPNRDYFGPDEFTFKVNDGSEDSQPVTVSISIAAVNDPPSFTLASSNIVASAKSKQVSLPGWALNISPGPSGEESQAVSFVVTNNNPLLFTKQPAIDANGMLTFIPWPNRKGTATVTVFALDNGGTADGGIDRSSSQIFTVTLRK